jgi:hypothetical protein
MTVKSLDFSSPTCSLDPADHSFIIALLGRVFQRLSFRRYDNG